MAIEENKRLMRRIYEEVISQGNLAVVDELLSPDFIERTPPPVPGVPTTGPDALKAFGPPFRAAFPDLQVTVEDLIAEGDKVVGRATWRGTHHGELPGMGLPPTGKQVTFTSIDIGRAVNGQFVEHWGQVDDLGMMQQLGVIPAPGQGQAEREG